MPTPAQPPSAPDDGGPAFPNVDGRDNPNFPGQRDIYASQGMSLRDWFAGQAIAAILKDRRYADVGNERAVAYEVARFSGIIADAMLEERAALAKAQKGAS